MGAKKIVFRYDGNKVDPAPAVAVNKEFIYANDTIVGYKYVLTITGYASSFNKKLNTTVSNISTTIYSLQDIKAIFMRNGKVLHIGCEDTSTNTVTSTMLMAYGGLLRSFETNESPNRLSQYVEYTATMDFNDVLFTDNNNTEIAGDSVASDDVVLNEQMRHLQSFTDNWNFTIGEEDMYRYYSRVSAEGLVNVEDYTTINVSYTIEATGKHTFDINGNTIPAWQRAKEFIERKLYTQIYIFRNTGPLAVANFNTIYYNSNDINLNDTTTQLNQTHTSTLTNIPIIYPILHNTVAQNYTIFNEVITCNTSEGAGSFTATYSCVLKFTNIAAPWPQKSIHTFTVSYDQVRDFTKAERTITVNGTLEGMLATNILAPASLGQGVNINLGGTTFGGNILNENFTGQVFNLPLNGKFIGQVALSPVSKYTNALDDFVKYIGNTPAYNYNYYGSDDLSPAFKAVLSINYATLFPNTLPTDISTCTDGNVYLSSILALPQSFSVDHDYNGSVSYSVTYSTSRSCSTERGFETLSITEEDPVPSYVEFIVPGRTGGPILQNLNTNSHKKITFNFQGTTKKGCLIGTPFTDADLNDFPILNGSGVCEIEEYVNFPPAVLCMLIDTEAAHPELIPESYKYDYNPIDGSFTLAKTYIVCQSGTITCFP